MSDDGGEIPGGLASYAESLARKPAMSERVVPDRQGYWIAKTKLGNEIVLRALGSPAVYVDLRGIQHLIGEWNGEWLAPVSSAEAVQAAVEALDVASGNLDSEGNDEAAAMCRNAIAGLTGGEW